MAVVPERRGILGIPVEMLDSPMATEICQKISDYLGECVAIWYNEDMQRYEIQTPVGDVTRAGLVCYCMSLSDNHDTTSVIEVKNMSAIEGMFQNGYSGNQQKVAGTNNIGPVRTPARNNQRARTVRDRRANEIQFPRHIPRPRNSWIIYRSDKTRELRDMDPSLTASDISRITSRLWAEELPHIKVQYQQKAQEEANAHMAMYPDYRYRARRPIPRHPKVDAMTFWDCLANDASQNNEARQS